MGILTWILLVIFVLVAICMVLIILAQDDGTEGAGIIFGSAASQQYGAKKGNIVTKTTSILAGLFLLIAFSLSFLFQYNRNANLEIIAPDSNESTSSQWWDTSSTNQDDIPLEIPEQSVDDVNSTQIKDNATTENDTSMSTEELKDDSKTPKEKSTE